MDILNKEDLKELLDITDEHCVSIYMPTHRTGREQQQDPVRIKNLIAEAEKKLITYGVNRLEVQKLIQPVEDLLPNKNFWQHQSDGLAIFLSPSYFRTYRLPFNFDELMMLGGNFHIKPLLPLLTPDGQFYILEVTLNAIRLFQCTRNTVSERELSNVPTSMKEALYMDEPAKYLDFHTGTKNPGTSGSRPAVFHGQGAQSEEENKKNILRYFQYVDRGLNKLIEDKFIPMILTGVEYLLPIYHDANNYPHLLHDGLKGNPEGLSPEELLQRVWGLVEPIFSEEQQNTLKQFEKL